MDFYRVKTSRTEGKKCVTIEVYPDFGVTRSRDLMVRGKSFYAIWDEERGLWSTDIYDVPRLVDSEMKKKADEILLKEKADHLNYIMSDMANAVDSITNSVSESSQAIKMSADNTMEIVGEMNGISEAMDKNVEVTGKLNDATDKFIQV